MAVCELAVEEDLDEASMVEGLSRWILAESPTRETAAVNRMLDLVAQEFDGLPVGLERLPGRNGLGDTLVVRAGPQRDARGILVMSHVDTVHPLGTIDGPLPLRRDGDRLYGPGVYDMKGGAFLALQAFKRVAARDGARLPMTFLFTPDEEIGSPTTRELIEDEARRAAFALVTEPARDGGKIVTARKGVGRFEVHVTGRPAHSGARHQDGRSAIREAARQILAVEGLTDYARGITTTVGLMSGGTAPNVIPHHAYFSVDLRVTNVADGEAAAAAILALKAVDPDVKVSVTGGMNRPPYTKTPEIEQLLVHAQGLARDIGFELEDSPMTGGGADGNFTAALGVPTLDGLGIDGDGAHTLHEYGLISSLVPRARLMERLLETLA
ncbi:M20 family metallopeptidase [Chelatococcus sp. SYSU_G07232]|uniref:M20 family metallopeptidase n=1 Tax=Chelatococcus albus TaxID=3047466 RepID=A0ABT7ACL5_9HYPH|nr:M20 family metallopeptidase [Chelatococcus sp. SYSU_G07232]MDJ1157116.1 M20 family metallopeptidase [Chelatococcus sp. SYSU_G07232]